MMKENSAAHPRQLSPLRQVRLIAAIALFAFVASCLMVSAGAATITGMVTNGTTNKPAAGDAVVLIGLDQQMQEISRTKTGADGHFSLQSPDPGMHLIRVDHEGAGYFQPAPPNTPVVNIKVYDVVPSLKGVTTEADVMRFETDQQGLVVTRSIFVKNSSDPPRTQFSNHSYEFYLPADAELQGSAAMAPGGMPVQSSPVPLGEKGHYAFLFPIRPGETQFQLSYRLPYSGSLSLNPHLATPTTNFVVMLPKSMTFTPGSGPGFQTIREVPTAQTYLVRNLSPAQSFSFTVSGSGVMPRDTQTASQSADNRTADNQGADTGGAASSSATDTRPGIGLGVPIDTPDPLHKYRWWILGGIALIFAMAGGLLLRKPEEIPAERAPLPAAPLQAVALPGTGSELMMAIKDELFSIETDRMQGKLSDSEYRELKRALELVLRRALNRQLV